MRLNPTREAILKSIQSSSVPLSARKIHESLDGSVNLSTVYRSLDHLEKNRFVQTISISSVRFYYSQSEHGHFLHCRECGEIIQFQECGVDTLIQSLQTTYNYRIVHHLTFFEGICQTCDQYLNRKKIIQQME